MHLDPLGVRVVPGVVAERLGFEIGAEAPIHDVQDVAIECRGHAGGVVVGGLEHGPILHEVHTE